MPAFLPFLTSYDPPGTSEGSIDPLGLYQIADQMAVQLVPAVRERMQRIRFLTAITVGAMMTEDIHAETHQRDASPCLVWEWFVVEALTRNMQDEFRGVPGTLVARQALDQHGYLDARSYLKTPRIFGFHGVYKRLALRLGLVDVHLKPGPNSDGLLDAWARGLGFEGTHAAKGLLSRWGQEVRRGLGEKPPRTRPGWTSKAWLELAEAFAPGAAGSRERRYLRQLLLASDGNRLGALPSIWQLQAEFDNGSFQENSLHDLLQEREPHYGPLLDAIRAYEAFARSLQDAFNLMRSEAGQRDLQGFEIASIARDADFRTSVDGLCERFEAAHRALEDADIPNISLRLQTSFSRRFGVFAEPMSAEACACALCDHHDAIQLSKSADGKRPWFDRIGPSKIHIRRQYRVARPEIAPGRYVHDYRGWPIRRFREDLS